MTRVHSDQFAASTFNFTVVRGVLAGGRFDAAPADPYGFLYAANDDATAVSEVLLRDLPFDERGARLLPRSALRGRRISWLATAAELELVSLRSGQDLAAVGQDTWLTTSPPVEYALTREWAAAIRRWAPWAAGLTWRSRREPDGFACVFFADRCPEGCLVEVREGLPVPPGAQALDAGVGHRYVAGLLARYRVALA